MINVQETAALHRDMVVRWHEQSIDNPFDGVQAVICTQHSFNFMLWHEEDIARSPNVGDQRIAEVKRTIDRLNQSRNDWIEKIDDWITQYLASQGILAAANAAINTETPGSVVDRLSILALRVYHLQEQTQRDDVSTAHIASVEKKIAVCRVQGHDLMASLSELLADIQDGTKRHKTYRQFKMYNDPTLNPFLYQSPDRLAG